MPASEMSNKKRWMFLEKPLKGSLILSRFDHLWELPNYLEVNLAVQPMGKEFTIRRLCDGRISFLPRYPTWQSHLPVDNAAAPNCCSRS